MAAKHRSGKAEAAAAFSIHAVGQTWVQIKRQPCAYTLGFLSCFLVVTIAAAVQTMLEKAPVIFLQEAEAQEGQVDFKLYPGPWQSRPFLNYTLLSSVLADTPNAEDLSFHSPRIRAVANIHPVAACMETATTTAAAANVSLPEAEDIGLWGFALPPMSRDELLNGSSRTFCADSCLRQYCAPETRQGVELVAIDSEREKAMGLGRQWPHDPLGPGEAYLHSSVAEALGVGAGDNVLLQVERAASLVYAAAEGAQGSNLGAGPLADAAAQGQARNHSTFLLPMTVKGVVPSSEGKLPSLTTSFVFVEYQHLVAAVAAGSHPLVTVSDTAFTFDLAPSVVAAVRTTEGLFVVEGKPEDPAEARVPRPAGHIATSALANLPPGDRVQAYLEPNYDIVQQRLTSAGARLSYASGFSRLGITLPVMSTVRTRRFVTLFLGLLLNVLLVILFTLATLLVYSLLMINVEQRTFELAVRRMLGTSLRELLGLLVFQALGYGVPSWVLGMIAAQLLVLVIMGALVSATGFNLSVLLSGQAVLLGTLLGLLVPLVGSIGPIRTALGNSIREALDFSRAKTKAVKFSVTRASDAPVPWALLVVGGIASAFGFSIYYLLPLALLSFDLSLFLGIFFWILMGLLLGAVLLALNVESLLESSIAWVTLFWERRVIRNLALKNLVAHRIRNRKTAIMYSLALAFIVFINIAAAAQVAISRYRVRQDVGADLVVETTSSRDPISPEIARAVETLAYSDKYSDVIAATAPIALPLTWALNNRGFGGASKIAHLGRVYGSLVRLTAFPPTFQDTAFEEYLTVLESDQLSALRMDHVLYTARGSQGVVLSGGMQESIAARIGEPILFTQGESVDPGTDANVDGTRSDGDAEDVEEEGTGEGGTLSGFAERKVLRPSALLNSAPGLDFSRYSGSRQRDAAVSFPTYVRLGGEVFTSVRDVPLWYYMIRTAPDASEDRVAEFKSAVNTILADDDEQILTDVADQEGDLGATLQLIDLFFSFLTVVALFLCFFSLLSSMSANIAEQTKEIGVLRALGLKNSMLLRVYVYEAFVLVMAASVSGILIGIGVGWTFTAQQALFAQLPVPIIVPQGIIIAVVLAAVGCALLSSYFPAARLLRMPITRVLRGG